MSALVEVMLSISSRWKASSDHRRAKQLSLFSGFPKDLHDGFEEQDEGGRLVSLVHRSLKNRHHSCARVHGRICAIFAVAIEFVAACFRMTVHLIVIGFRSFPPTSPARRRRLLPLMNIKIDRSCRRGCIVGEI